MHFEFRPLLRKTFARKYPYPQTPAIRGKANPRGLGVWLSKPHFWKILETSEAMLGSTSGRCEDVLQDHGIWLWRSLTFGSLAATYEGKGKYARRQEAVALNIYNAIMIHKIQLPRNFREKKGELEKKSRRFPT